MDRRLALETGARTLILRILCKENKISLFRMKDYMNKKDRNLLGINLSQQRFAKSLQRVRLALQRSLGSSNFLERWLLEIRR